MYKYSIHTVKKGSIVLYVMLIGFLVLLTALTMFRFQLERHRDLLYNKANMESYNANSYNREKVFGRLYVILSNNGALGSRQSIKLYMKNNSGIFNISSEEVNLKLNSERELIMVTFPYNSIKDFVEYYDIDPKESGIRLYLVYSEFKTR